MQRISQLLAIAAGAVMLTHAAPTSLDNRVEQFTDDNPWIIRNLVIFNSFSNSTTNSTVQFSAQDPNPGLEMSTWCAYTANPGFNCDVQQYFHCQNSSMAFQWSGDQFWIQRSYHDPSTGSFPWGGVTNFGYVNTSSWPRQTYANGILIYQEEVNITCTETAA